MFRSYLLHRRLLTRHFPYTGNEPDLFGVDFRERPDAYPIDEYFTEYTSVRFYPIFLTPRWHFSPTSTIYT